MCFIYLVILLLPIHGYALTTEDLKSAPAEDLLNGVYSACNNESFKDLAALHSKYIEKKLLSIPNREKVFSFYCDRILLLFDKLGGDPSKGKYAIRPNPHSNNRFELCMSANASIKNCEYSFDVVIENNRLKKNEF